MVVELRLRLVRHGATRWSSEGRFAGHADIELSDAGRRQAATLRDRLGAGFDSVWSSDLRRCVETAALAGVKAKTTGSLRELDFGSIEGKRWEELDPGTQRDLVAFDEFHAPGGESVAAFTTRIDQFLEELRTGHHLLVTHGGVIRYLSRRVGHDVRVEPADWIDLRVSL